MTDRTSAPEGPDGRGTVATGGAGAATPADKATKPAAAPAGDGAATGNGAASAGAGSTNGGAGGGATPPRPTPSPPSARPVDDDPTTPGTETATPVPPHPASPPAPADDEPTVTVAPKPSPAARPTASGPTNGSGPHPPVPGPRPAPGPVPGPGPDAAAPPPWHRVPGHDAREVPPTRGGATTVGELLGDGPTVVFGPQAGEQGRSGSGARASESSGPTATGGWQAVRATRNRTPRQAALQLKRLDPWSVLKLALVLALVLFFIWLVAVGVLYGVLDGMGVWDQLNGTIASLSSDTGAAGSSPLFSAGRVFGFAAVVGAINSLLFAVAMTISAFVYNVSADLVGGVEITLSERD